MTKEKFYMTAGGPDGAYPDTDLMTGDPHRAVAQYVEEIRDQSSDPDDLASGWTVDAWTPGHELIASVAISSVAI